MKRQIIRLTEEDLNNIVKESVRQIVSENRKNVNEGLGNWMKGAALGGAMAMSPMANAQTTQTDSLSNDTINTNYQPSMQIEDIVHQIEEATDSNYVTIHEAEQIVMEEGDLADEIINACFLDEYDNFITLESRDIRTISEEDYEILEKELMNGKTLVNITIYDGEKQIPNCIIDLDVLKSIIGKYDEYEMSEFN